MSLGVDISNVNGHVDLAAVKRAHPALSVVGIKRDEGMTFRDSFAAENFKAARKLGLVGQFYHFGRPESSPGEAGGQREAHAFLVDIHPYLGKPNMGVPVLDYESVRDVGYARGFVQAVESAIGHTPHLYCSKSRVAELVADSVCRRCHFWVADYGVTRAEMLAGLEGVRVVVWQYTDHFDGAYDASQILVSPQDLLLDPVTYLYVVENGRVVRKLRYGGGAVAKFLRGRWLRKALKSGRRLRLRRGA